MKRNYRLEQIHESKPAILDIDSRLDALERLHEGPLPHHLATLSDPRFDYINHLCWVWGGSGQNPKLFVRRIIRVEIAPTVVFSAEDGLNWDNAELVRPEDL